MSTVKVVKLLDSPVVLQFSGGINPTGEYDNTITYSTGDSVSYLGASYVAIQSTVGNLPTDSLYWQLLAEKGDQGDQGIQGVQGPTGPTGPAGASYQEQFETVSKNLRSWNATLNYTGSDLTSIVYTDGTDIITKTFNYSGGLLVSLVLSGDTPSGIDLTKTLGYTGSTLTSITYS
jgi:hypothetical protein